MDANGNNPDRLTSTRRTTTALSWAPDGKQIVFSSRGSGGTLGIFAMDTYGKNQRTLTDGKGDDTFPVWQPQTSGDVVVLSGK